MKLKPILTAFLFLCVAVIIAQQDQGGGVQDFYSGEVSKMIHMPTSPEAQAFTKYGGTQANMYSGTPQISIPLHSIQGREMSLPLSLTYDASGIKVEQKSSWVGLAWNLNVGGRISRIVNGLPDDYISTGNTTNPYETIFNSEQVALDAIYYLENYADQPNPQFPTKLEAENYVKFLHKVANGHKETERDYFSLNVMGLNETIVFERIDGLNVPRAMNNPRVKVIPTYNDFITANGPRKYILSWEIVSENGTRYFFDKEEISRRTNLNDASNESELPGDIGLTTYASSWGLTKIISKNQKDIFEFYYVDRGFQVTPTFPSSASAATTVIQTQFTNPIYTEPIPTIGNITSEIKEIFLNEVWHNGKKVVGMIMGDRDDVLSNVKNSRLATINFYNVEGSLPYKSIDFLNNNYFNSDQLGQQYTDIRLKLNGLTINDNEGTSVQNYYFEYDRPDDLPSRYSLDQDFLGFYNGAGNSLSLFQKLEIDDTNFPGANRDSDCYYSKIGLLTQVTYPTGGRTSYQYESHDEYDIKRDNSINFKFFESLGAHTNTREEIFINSNGTLCDESVSPQPKAKIYKFVIREGEAGDYDFKFEKANNSGSKAIILNPTVGRPRSYNNYCDFSNPFDEHLLTDAGDSFSIWTVSATKRRKLEVGKYAVLLYVDAGSSGNYDTASLTISNETTEITRVNQKLGGQRISEIVDYSFENEVAMTKKYNYREDGESTGEVNYEPILYREPKQVKDNVLKPALVRYASAIRSNQPYVVYTSVSELKLDKDGRSLGSQKFDFYNNGSKGATPDTNVPYTNNLYSGLNVGTVKTTTTKRQDGKTVAIDSLNWFTTNYISNKIESLVVRADDDQSGKTIFIMVHNPNTPNEYFTLEYLWSYACDGGISTGSLGPVCILPSYLTFDDLNDFVGSMDAKYSAFASSKSYAFGRYGGVNQNKSTSYFYDENDNEEIVSTINETKYDSIGEFYHLPLKQFSVDSKGDNYETEFEYAFQKSDAASNAFVDNNNLVEVVKTKTIKKNSSSANDKIISLRENSYEILPWSDGNIILPKTITTQKGGDLASNNDDRISFEFYPNGNLKSAQKIDGPNTLYIWGYDRMYPVAKIVNATMAEINQLFNTGESNFNTGSGALTATQESTIRNGLSGAMVTTYTYIPYVGISSMTDPRGYSIHYEYDNFNRLKLVKDDAGKIVTDYEYGYKQAVTN